MVRRSDQATTNGQEGQEYLTVEEVAEILGVPKSFVYRRTCRGASDPIVHYRFGGHLRFLRQDVDEWIRRGRIERGAVETSFEFGSAWMSSWADGKSTEAGRFMTPLKPRDTSARSAALTLHPAPRFTRPRTLCPRSGFASTSPTSRPRHAQTGGRGPGSAIFDGSGALVRRVRSEGEGGGVWDV